MANNPEATHLEVDENEIDNEDVEEVITRRGMWIPNVYAMLCLGNDLSPVDMWNHLYSNIVQNGHLQACTLLIGYLQYQLLGGDQENAAIYNEDDLMQTCVNSKFLRHRSHVLSDLQLSDGMENLPTNVGAAPGISTADLQALILALRTGHTNPAQASNNSNASNPTTVDRRWTVNLPSLLKLCMVQSASQLTPIWAAIAKGPKKEERTIPQSALDNHARTPGAATTARLTVTKE